MGFDALDPVQAAYGRLSERYIELFGRVSSVEPDDLALIERHLTPGSGPVLDVGCGPGHLTAHLRAHGVDAVGIDLVPEFLDHALAADPGGRYVLGSLRRLPVADAFAAGILAWFSLIHLEPDDLDAVLAELRRVSAPDAPIVVGFFHGDVVEPFDHKVLSAYRWPVDELAARLRAAGFTEVERMVRPGMDVSGARPYAVLVAR